jgi:hypothetical protein
MRPGHAAWSSICGGLACALACEVPEVREVPERPVAGPPSSPVSFGEVVPPIEPVVPLEVAIVEPDPGDPKLDIELAFARGIVPFQPSRRSLRSRERRLESLLDRCAGGRAASAVVQVTIAGRTGRAVMTRVSTPLWPELGRCLEDAIRREQFPVFTRDEEVVTYALTSRPRGRRGLPEGWLY